MSKWHFNGCSLSTDLYLNDPQDAFAHLVGKHFSKEICIKAKRGNSNHIIFTSAIESLLDDDCELTFVQLTSPGRMIFHHDWDHRTNTLGECALDVVPTNRWKDFVKLFSLLDREFNQFDLISHYVPILNRIAELVKKKVYFINGYLYIDPIFLGKESNINYALLQEETKLILDLDNKKDHDIAKQLEDVRLKLSVIDPAQWIMLFDSLSTLRVDLGKDNRHPGIKSNKRYAEIIIKYIEEINGI